MSAALPDPPPRLRELLDRGVPQFPGDIARCFPGNASPYLVEMDALAEALAGEPEKAALYARLRDMLASLSDRFRVHAVLVGGSLLDPEVSRPRDLDAVVFYSPQDALAATDLVPALSEAMRAARSRALDLRFVPVDGAPHVLIQAACFFAGLYASDRRPDRPRRGALLLVETRR
jgi:hypothetical protein